MTKMVIIVMAKVLLHDTSANCHPFRLVRVCFGVHILYLATPAARQVGTNCVLCCSRKKVRTLASSSMRASTGLL